MLPQGGQLHKCCVVVLLPERHDALRQELLQQRGRLHQRQQRSVWVSSGKDTVWERGEHDLLRGGAGMRVGLSDGGVVRDGIGLRERNDLHLVVILQQQLVIVFVELVVEQQQ
jgi:hypothetical protein